MQERRQDEWEELLSFFPCAPEWRTDWQGLEHSKLRCFSQQMAKTMQNPYWHGEGDVWTHTQMVCSVLAGLSDFRGLSERKRQEVFFAALLHDIGKIPCTRLEDGKWVSPGHSVAGAKMAREWLWSTYGLCGTPEGRCFRETICSLIRYHSIPVHVPGQKDPEYTLLKAAADGELAADFSLSLLTLLAEADVRGRVTETAEDSADAVSFCAELAEECGVYKSPYVFPSAYTQHAYLSGRTGQPGFELYDNTWGEVILLAGMPGTGKDTWMKERCAGLPAVSLDVLRRQMRISPKEEQGAVVNAAKEQARAYLRKKQPFVWNATNLTAATRGKLVRLCEDYGAAVRIVFLETGWEEELERNRGREREAEVPEQVIRRMLRSLVLPGRWEAQYVDWECV